MFQLVQAFCLESKQVAHNYITLDELKACTNSLKIATYDHVDSSYSHRSGMLGISRLVSVSHGGRDSTKTVISLRDIEKFELENYETPFQQIVIQEAVKGWLAEKTKYSKPVYMIADYSTASILTHSRDQTTRTQQAGSMSPGNALSAIAGEIQKLSLVTDLEAGGQLCSERELTNKTALHELVVWAVLYRKVKFRWLRWTPEMSQQNNQWTVILKARGEEDEKGIFLVDGELEHEMNDEGEGESSFEETLVMDKVQYDKYMDESGNVYLVCFEEDVGVCNADLEENKGEDDGDWEI